jgi:hypothetical protein
MAIQGPIVLRGRFGVILLALWLILTGAIALFKLQMDALPIIMGLLAIVAGICLLIGV